MSDYKEAVESIAREIIKDNGLNDNDWYEAVEEAVGSSWWLTYDANHETILDYTDNEPDNSDVREMLGKNDLGDWRKVREVAARLAMQNDVNAKLRDIEDEYFECEDCGEITEEDDKHDHADGELCPVCFKKRFRCDVGVESVDNPTQGVILHSHELNTQPESVTLKGDASLLAVGVFNGTTPIGILFDRLDEYPNEFDASEELRAQVVEYLRAKYAEASQVWEPETFLDDDQSEPVRLDVPHPEDNLV
jgi:hypothetical protein